MNGKHDKRHTTDALDALFRAGAKPGEFVEPVQELMARAREIGQKVKEQGANVQEAARGIGEAVAGAIAEGGE